MKTGNDLKMTQKMALALLAPKLGIDYTIYLGVVVLD